MAAVWSLIALTCLLVLPQDQATLSPNGAETDQMGPPSRIPPRLTELKSEMQDINASLERIRNRTDSPGSHAAMPPHRERRGPGFLAPFQRRRAARRLQFFHRLQEEQGRVLLERRRRVAEEAWMIFDEQVGQVPPPGVSDIPTKDTGIKEGWMVRNFGPREPDTAPPGPGMRWDTPESPMSLGPKMEALRKHLLLTEGRIRKMEKRIEEQAGEIRRLREEVRRLREKTAAGRSFEKT